MVLFRKILDELLSSPRAVKRLITATADFAVVIFSLWSAFSLRHGEFYLPPQHQWWVFLLAPVIAIPVFMRFGLYRAIIRYLGMQAIWTIINAIALFTIIFAVIVLISGVEGVPRTVYGINGLVLLILAGGSRLLARWWISQRHSVNKAEGIERKPLPAVIIYGAGSSGIQLASALKVSNQLNPVAFIDDNETLKEQHINGITIHPFHQLSYLIDKYNVRDILLAMPSAAKSRRSEIIRLLEPYSVHVRTLPDLMDIAEGKIEVSDIQEVDIADLLGREQVEPISQLLTANITGKSVFVTGAGGSIGSELCRQIIKLEPTSLVLYELNEFALYGIEKELNGYGLQIPLISVLGTVLDQPRVEAICQQFQVNTIYHTAAYKHVPRVEKNMTEGVRNNVFGTLRCAQAAIASAVETFVLISTDKAVRPTNTMGASKRFAELVLQALAEDRPQNCSTRFSMVRFGNVLGSSGSVVPLFREQIACGGPVTVTDERIIRYFMTIPEAAELVIQAGAMGQGGDVFVLDMGEPIRIVDMARRLIHLSGFSKKDEEHPEGDIEISYTGLRPGEKLYEELLIGDDVSDTEHSKIMRAQEKIVQWHQLTDILNQLDAALEKHDCQQLQAILLLHVDGFKLQGEVADWLA